MAAERIETLTPTEAAVVAGVSVRDVNRMIDEKILPEGFYAVGSDRARRFKTDACTLIAFYFRAADRLTSEERMRTIAKASERLRKHSRSAREREWIIGDDFLRVDLTPFLTKVREQLAKLASARALVVEDPAILGGTAVIRGTRIPVYDIAASVAAGLPRGRILAAYPSLTAESVELAALYAEANPQRGRPPRSAPPPRGALIVSRRRTRRRKLVS